MVGIVLVSHSQALAEALVDYTKMMAPDARVVAAGGLEDGSFGTSYDRIEAAVEAADADGDGVAVLMDMGSAVMTAKMVLEDLDGIDARLVDCPFVEGAVQATVTAQGGATLDGVVAAMAGIYDLRKL